MAQRMFQDRLRRLARSYHFMIPLRHQAALALCVTGHISIRCHLPAHLCHTGRILSAAALHKYKVPGAVQRQFPAPFELL